jgi:methylamine dehydrogenase light chain
MTPKKLISRSLELMDQVTGNGSRQLARKTSRRSFITRLGTVLTGAAFLPLLPVARAFAAEPIQEMGDPQSCDYWRYCALGGTLCTCCGGTVNSCPPGLNLHLSPGWGPAGTRWMTVTT